ncbi:MULTISPECIES: AAA family ATPase [unclassified Pseudoalteromonas]|uniref:AAA family ATPase n=1 Tax=unclassified Pseudoalteromonas TaxID=194690 RepID=UPI00386420A2
MYTVEEITIDGFWHRLNAKCKFNEDVNIIIGKNGTGKTTFMNIVHSALSVDLDGILESDFNSVVIKLCNGAKKKTIKLNKLESDRPPFQIIEYQISNKKHLLRAVAPDDRIPSSYRRRAMEEARDLKRELNAMINLSSLSVYRLRNTEDLEIKDRTGKKIISPVDHRLEQLKSALTQYQLELSQEINTISTKLQDDVLASILYSDSRESDIIIPRDFNKVEEKRSLFLAYKRLRKLDGNIRGKITKHIDAIDEAVKKLNNNEELTEKDFGAFQSYVRTQEIIEMSLKSESEIDITYQPITNFLNMIGEFIEDKGFVFSSGNLMAFSRIIDDFSDIPMEKLSSGEKQLLILLIETLLQKNKKCVYLTDEPELSLHVQWQRNILPAIKKLNPNAQIIAATHSPEVASKYKTALIDMKMVLSDAKS